MLLKSAFVIIAISIGFLPVIAAAEIAGIASVIDGDTLEIHGQRIRLHGIDAPESPQLCQKEGKDYRCGQKAAFALADLIVNKTVHCEKKDIDRYKRIVGQCFVGTLNLNAWMVENGWALAYRAYSNDYVPQQERARGKKAGIWDGEFLAPWEYRRQQRQTSELGAEAPTGCSIKGNINANGVRIYHEPGGSGYAATKINPAMGERWFCTEGEALKAGWRKAR